MTTEVNIPEEAFELGAGQLVGHPIASVDRWDAASDVIRVAVPLILAAELERLADLCDAEAEGTDGGFPDGIGVASDMLRRRASELRGEGHS